MARNFYKLEDWASNRPKRGFEPPVRLWHQALFTTYGPILEDGHLVQTGVLRPESARHLATGPFPRGAVTPLSFKALVLEMWSRQFSHLPQKWTTWFFILNTNYPEFLRWLYIQHPKCKSTSIKTWDFAKSLHPSLRFPNGWLTQVCGLTASTTSNFFTLCMEARNVRLHGSTIALTFTISGPTTCSGWKEAYFHVSICLKAAQCLISSAAMGFSPATFIRQLRTTLTQLTKTPKLLPTPSGGTPIPQSTT